MRNTLKFFKLKRFLNYNYYNFLFEDIKIKNNRLQSIFKYLKLPTSNFIIKRYVYKLQSNIHITFLFNKYLRLNKLTFLKKRHRKLMINHFVFKKSVYFFKKIKHFNNLLLNIKNKINIKYKLTNIFTFFRKKYFNNYDLIMKIKNMLLLCLYRWLCFRYLGGTGLELPEAFNIDQEAFDLLKTEVASAPMIDENCAATKLMIFNLIAEANTAQQHFLIPSQAMEHLYPGDFYNLSNNLGIKRITELKYVFRDTTFENMPKTIHILKTNLYGSGNDLLYGVSKEDQKEILQEKISEIKDSNRTKLLYEEIMSDTNNEYLTDIAKKKMLKEVFKGRLTSEEMHERWELMFKEDLSKHIKLDETTTTKHTRTAMFNKNSWDNLAETKVLEEKENLESIKKKGCNILDLNRDMLNMTDSRTNWKYRSTVFGGDINVTNVTKIVYSKWETPKQIFPNNTIFNKYFIKMLKQNKLH